MKKYLSLAATLLMCAGSLAATESEIAFERQSDRAPYTEVVEGDTTQVYGANYSNAVRVEKGITLEEAFDIAQNDSDIAYFVRCKEDCVVTSDCEGDEVSLSFEPGDTVFFDNTQEMSLQDAPGFADTYVKVLVTEDIE